MMPNEAVRVYCEAGGRMSSPTADVAMRLYRSAGKMRAKTRRRVELW